jgi:hypothetical protein
LDTGSVALQRRYIDSQPPDVPPVPPVPSKITSHLSKSESSAFISGAGSVLQSVSTVVTVTSGFTFVEWSNIPSDSTYYKIDLSWKIPLFVTMISIFSMNVSIGTPRNVYQTDASPVSSIIAPNQTGTTTATFMYSTVASASGGVIRINVGFSDLSASCLHSLDAWLNQIETGVIT